MNKRTFIKRLLIFQLVAVIGWVAITYWRNQPERLLPRRVAEIMETGSFEGSVSLPKAVSLQGYLAPEVTIIAPMIKVGGYSLEGNLDRETIVSIFKKAGESSGSVSLTPSEIKITELNESSAALSVNLHVKAASSFDNLDANHKGILRFEKIKDKWLLSSAIFEGDSEDQ